MNMLGLSASTSYGYAVIRVARFAGAAVALACLLAGAVNANEIPTSSMGAGSNAGRSDSRFGRLVRYVGEATAGERLDFAHVAVVQMAMEHEQALAVAVHQRAKTQKLAAKRLRWVSATNAYLGTLAASLDSIDRAADVPVHLARAGQPTILIEGVPLLVSSLNMKSPELLGDSIVEAFCRLHPCDFLRDVQTSHEAISALQIPTPNPTGSMRWSFGDGAYAVLGSDDGLNFMFATVSNRVRKEQICNALSQELRMLGDRLEQARLAGYVIDWQALRIEGSGEGQVVYVDGAESFVRLSAPTLAQASRVLNIAGPWLEARGRGETITQFFPSADLLLKNVVARSRAAPITL